MFRDVSDIILGRTKIIKIFNKKRQFKALSMLDFLKLSLILKKYRIFIYLYSKNGITRHKILLIRFLIKSIRKELKEVLGWKPKKKELSKILNIIKQIYRNPFYSKNDKIAWYDRKYESWIYSKINLIAINYGWSEKEILNLNYLSVFEYEQVIINSLVNKKIDDMSIVLSAYVGSKSIMDNFNKQFIKRNVPISEQEVIEQNKIELEKLNGW